MFQTLNNKYYWFAVVPFKNVYVKKNSFCVCFICCLSLSLFLLRPLDMDNKNDKCVRLLNYKFSIG